jgi:hypothetical protein
MSGAGSDITHPTELAKRDGHHRHLWRGVCFVPFPHQLALPNAMRRAPWFREQETALDAVSLVVLSSHVVSDALPLVLNDVLLILGAARCACTQVRGAPLVGHVVQT